MTDMLICFTPWVEGNRAPLAPAVLKSVAGQAGFHCKTLDLNAVVQQQVNAHPWRKELTAFFLRQELTPQIAPVVADIIEHCVQLVMSHDPGQVALSLLSQDSQFFTWWFCYHMRTVSPQTPIVIGGSGIKHFIADSRMVYAEELRQRGMIDHYIFGDGEQAFVEYLRGNMSYPGINSDTWEAIEDLNVLPWPDFSDYDFDLYANRGVPICDSRGCVRACEFCDIIEHWKSYKYRHAQNIWEEIQHQIAETGISQIFFYNSLTNGNMREFTKLLDLLADYNSTAHQRITWDGYFIVRNARQHPESMWAKLRDSGATLILGIESVIEHVRKGLGKNFDNVDIDYHLEMAKKYSVPVSLLLIVGYPTETLQDFETTMQWFRDRVQYRDIIGSVQCTLCSILPNTELDRRTQELGIVQGALPVHWITPTTNISTSQREQYHDQLQQLLQELGYNDNTC